MGRGEGELGNISAPQARSAGAPSPERAAVGQVWRRRDGAEGELRIVHIEPTWSHVSVMVRTDELSSRLYSSRKLMREWEPASAAPEGAESFSLKPPPPRKDTPQSIMLGGQEAWKAILAREGAEAGVGADEIEEMTPKQSGYLKALCETHNREFDPKMSKQAASALIDELKRLPEPPAPASKRKTSQAKRKSARERAAQPAAEQAQLV